MSQTGEVIRYWRKYRSLSQLELALAANVSSRHISFLETGRAKPSREMIIVLSNAMNIPLSERNVLFSASGFAEAYSRMSVKQPEMKLVKHALTIMLNNHAPYPALVLDWDWNIVMTNEPQQKLVNWIAHQQPNFPASNNILDLLFDPNAFRPFVENWEEVAFILIQRIQRERMIHQDRKSNLLDRLLKYPGVPNSWKKSSFEVSTGPMINLVLKFGDLRLKLFSTLASFGTAIDVTMQELIIEQYFPADEATKHFFEANLTQ